MRNKYQYFLWEDYINGMYNPPIHLQKEINLSIKIFNDKLYFKKCCLDVIDNWKISCDENLNNRSMNRIAWMGQSALNINDGIKEIVTKSTWKELNSKLKNTLNKIANETIIEYEKRNKSVYKKMGESLF